MGAPAALAISSLALTGASISQSRRAEKSQREGNRVREVQTNIQTMKERRNQIREARIRRAQLLVASEASGTVGSSAEVGAIGSIQSQLSSNIGYLSGTRDRSNLISLYNQRAASSTSRANIASSLSNLSLAAGGEQGLRQGAKKLFGS